MVLDGCSAQPEGVDDDRLGVLLNYVCSAALLAAACALLRRYGRRGLRGTLTELGMSLGYLLGGLVHDRFPNRAVRDVCAHRAFYPTFAASYAAMIASAWAWSGADAPGSPPRTKLGARALLATRAALLASALLIVGGALACQAGGATLVDAKIDDCGAGHPRCDAVMLGGEGLFYLAWIFAWAVAAARVAPRLKGPWARRHNAASVGWLLLGPGQIYLVCAVPLALHPGDADAAGAASMRWYCALRTGVTYILAVLLSHLSTSAVSSHLLARADVAYEPVAAELGPIESGA